MEELRSTETLDREILEDARKKAFKIIKTADASVESQARQWENKTQKAIADIRKNYEQNTEQQKQEMLARFPLDKRRMRSEISEDFLVCAMNDFLGNMSRSNLLLILEQELEKRLASCSKADLQIGGTENNFQQTGSVEDPKAKYRQMDHQIGRKIIVTYQKMEENEVQALLRKTLDKPEVKGKCRFADFQIEQDAETGATFPAIVLDTHAVRIMASVENMAAEMLLNKRAELIASLLGEGALND
jgi:vacuolar-type H+-ATPase subunit E/Vma4